MVYGKQIRHAQVYLVKHVPHGSRVLILGGGTGWILEVLDTAFGSLDVCYVDASERMIAKAKRRRHSHRIRFISGTEANVPDETFDVIITAFYLDMFPDEKLNTIVLQLSRTLTPRGKWLAADFVDNKKWWQRMLLSTMYYFFNLVCDVEARHLPEWDAVLIQNSLRVQSQQYFFHGFIRSVVFNTTDIP